MATSQLLMLGLSRSQDIILARSIGVSAVGIYRTAWKTVDLVSQAVVVPFSTVLLPALSKLQFDMAAFERGYLRMLSTSAILSFPALIGIGVLADQIIPVVYGPHWASSIPVAQVLTFLVLPFSLDFFADPAMVVLKKSSVIFRLALVKLITTLVFCIAAAPYGIVAVAIAYVSRAYLTMIVQLLMFRRATGIRCFAVLGSVAPQLVASVVMGLAVFALAQLLPATMFPATMAGKVVRLGLCVAAGAAIYAASLFVVLGGAKRRELLSLLKSLRAREPKVAA